MPTERLQKILAKAGIASRRRAEEMIALGEVSVNGKTARIGDKAELGVDSIKVKGKLISTAAAPVYMLFYKPKGVLSTLAATDERPTLQAFAKNFGTRVYPVGRLDYNSEGLLILTNDGDFAERLQKNKRVLRVYNVKVKGTVDEERLKRLTRGAKMGEHGYFKPHSAKKLEELSSKTVVQVVVQGAGAIDVKGFVEFRGFLVEKIVRTAIGHLNITGLLPGQHRTLERSQVEALFAQPELADRSLERMREKAEKRLNPDSPRARAERSRRSGTKKAERIAVGGGNGGIVREAPLKAKISDRIGGSSAIRVRKKPGAPPARPPRGAAKPSPIRPKRR